MARRSSSNPFDSQEEPVLDMSSLIDVAFLLLIYFIVSTQLTREETDVSLSLPGANAASSSQQVKIDQMMIRIDENSAVFVNNDVVETDITTRTLRNLNDRLQRYADSAQMSNSEPMVIVDCHDDALEQRFIDVLNAITGAKIDNVSLTK